MLQYNLCEKKEVLGKMAIENHSSLAGNENCFPGFSLHTDMHFSHLSGMPVHVPPNRSEKQDPIVAPLTKPLEIIRTLQPPLC